MTNWFGNPAAQDWSAGPADAGLRDFHRGLPGYAPTALIDLAPLAEEVAVGRVLIKDESSRLGLPAFKILGASWACTRAVERTPGATLVTATDGNHGRAVARTAARLGVRATVFVPAIMLAQTAARIEDEGAQVVRVDGDYDETVRVAAAYAEQDATRALVQDTAWPGYEEVPGWIVAGYDTIVAEIDEQLGRAPDLVVVPVGVGSLAQAVVTHYRRPHRRGTRVLAVEPDTAGCLIASLAAGRPASVPTAGTVMAGLNCGTVSSLAWAVLRAGLDAAVVVSDEAALAASADLATLAVSSGPSGAATLAGLRRALADPVCRDALAVGADAVVVLLNTEGRQP